MDETLSSTLFLIPSTKVLRYVRNALNRTYPFTNSCASPDNLTSVCRVCPCPYETLQRPRRTSRVATSRTRQPHLSVCRNTPLPSHLRHTRTALPSVPSFFTTRVRPDFTRRARLGTCLVHDVGHTADGLIELALGEAGTLLRLHRCTALLHAR